MKIAQIVSTFPPYHGGIGNVAYEYSRRLVERGHQVKVITASRGASSTGPTGFEVCSVKPYLRYGNSGFMGNLSRLVDGYDIVHCHYPFIGAESLLKISNKLVVTYHMDLLGTGLNRVAAVVYQRLFLPRLIGRADKIIFTSGDYMVHSRANAYQSQWPDKFTVIPLGFSDDFCPSPAKSPAPPTVARTALFVATLDKAHYFKGLDVLLQSLKILNEPRLSLQIVGDGDLRPYYEKQVARLDLANVVFLGRLSSSRLVKTYQESDFLVLASVDSSEAFGLVVLQALACQKPVVVSDLPGPRSLVSQGQDGFLVRPGDSRDLADKLGLMLGADLAVMGEKGRQKVQARYRWPEIIDQIEEIYRGVL